jgi:hypothetical protein
MAELSLSRLRERAGERVSEHWDSPYAERTLTRAFGATSPASGSGEQPAPTAAASRCYPALIFLLWTEAAADG